jgi:hypothetical protein
MKINIKAFAIAAGIWWGLGVFCLTWWLILTHGATGDSTILGRLYPGYNISPTGSVIGLAWGLVDGAIGGAVLAWLYDRFTSRFSKGKESQS